MQVGDRICRATSILRAIQTIQDLRNPYMDIEGYRVLMRVEKRLFEEVSGLVKSNAELQEEIRLAFDHQIRQ